MKPTQASENILLQASLTHDNENSFVMTENEIARTFIKTLTVA